MANCPNCNNDLVKAPNWEYQGKTFSREICNLCGHKGKAYLVSPQDVLPSPRPQPSTTTRTTPQPKTDDLRSYAMSYAKDLVVAMIGSGLKIDKPGVKTSKIFRTLYKEISNPFTVKYEKEQEITEIDFDQNQSSQAI